MCRSPSRLVSSIYFLLTTIFRLQMPLFLVLIILLTYWGFTEVESRQQTNIGKGSVMFSPSTRADVPDRISEIRRVRGTTRDGRCLGLLEKLAFIWLKGNSEVLVKWDRSVFFWVIILLCVCILYFLSKDWNFSISFTFYTWRYLLVYWKFFKNSFEIIFLLLSSFVFILNSCRKQSVGKTLVGNLWTIGIKYTDGFTDEQCALKNIYLLYFFGLSIDTYNISLV